jgi:TolB-like protein
MKTIKYLIATVVFLGVHSQAHAGSLQDAVSSMAQEVLAPIKAKGDAPVLVNITSESSPAEGLAVTEALTKSLGKHVRIIDRASATIAVQEMAANPDSPSGEILGAVGARLMITGTVQRAAGGFAITLRVVDTQSGEVVATTADTYGQSSAGTQEVQSLDVQLRRLTDLVASGLDKMAGEIRYQRFAVMPFEELGGSTKDKQLGTLVSSQLLTGLNRDHGMLMVERGQLNKLIEEMSLAQLGVVDEAKSAEMGKMLGADAMLVGSVAEAGDRYKVSVRAVGTQSGKIILTENIDLPAADLVALSSEAVVLRTRTGSLYRSLLLPGWGQVYNRQPVKAALFVALEVSAVTLALLSNAQGAGFEDDYKKLDQTADQREFDRLTEKAEDAFGWRNRLIWTAVAVHGLNVLDALLSGKSYDSAQLTAGPQGAAAMFSF